MIKQNVVLTILLSTLSCIIHGNVTTIITTGKAKSLAWPEEDKIFIAQEKSEKKETADFIVVDLKKNKKKVLKSFKDTVSCIDYHKKALLLAAGSWDGSVVVWNLKTGKILFQVQNSKNAVSSIKISPDGSEMVVGSWDGIARVWSLKPKKLSLSKTKPKLTIKHNKLSDSNEKIEPGRSINGVDWSRDGSTILTASADTKIKLWDAFSGSKISSIKCDAAVNCALFDTKGNAILSVTDKIYDSEPFKIICIYDTNAQKNILKEKVNESLIAALWTEDDDGVLALYKNKITKLDNNTGNETIINKNTDENITYKNDFVISPDAKKAVLGTSTSKVIIIDLDSKKEEQQENEMTNNDNKTTNDENQKE